MTDSSDLVDRVAEAIRPVIQGHIARAYGIDDLGALTHEVAEEIVSVLSTWDGIMALLDMHYPESVFPTAEDRKDRDTGPRIVSLLRQIDESRVSDERMRHIREVCLNCLNRDVPGSDRYWLANSVLNIMNGTIDEQIRCEIVARDPYHSDPSDPT